MNHRQIEVFAAVMQTGTTASAAELLHISQPSVSKTIQDLERSIGFLLFERVRSRLVPTPEGRLFQRSVDASFVGMGKLKSDAARIRNMGSGEIRIACLGALTNNIVPLALGKFRTHYSEVAVTLQSRLSNDIRDLVATGEFHIGIAADEVDTTGLYALPFTSYPACVAIFPGHPFEKRDVVTLADLDGMDFIALAPKDTVRVRSELLFESAGIQPKTIVETPLSSTVCALVAAGLGCGLVNPLTYRDHGLGEVILKPFVPEILFRSMILSLNDQHSRIMTSLIDCLFQAMKAVAPPRTIMRGERATGEAPA